MTFGCQWTCHAHEKKVVIQSAFDVEYSCVIEHTVYVSDSPEA